MKKIPSFEVNHLLLKEGIYISRKDRINENVITTFDLRFTIPNKEPVMDTAAVHAIEHLAATYLRNDEEWKDRVIYFGPMGCRTGFYLLMLDTTLDEVKPIVKECFEKCLEMTEIPGSKRQECGNYLDHDLEGAKEEIRAFLPHII